VFHHFLAYSRLPTSATPTNCQINPFAKEFEDEEVVKANIIQRTRIVLSSRESSQILEEIWARKDPIAVDCEGISLGNKGQLTTVQASDIQTLSFTYKSVN